MHGKSSRFNAAFHLEILKPIKLMVFVTVILPSHLNVSIIAIVNKAACLKRSQNHCRISLIIYVWKLFERNLKERLVDFLS